MQNSTSTTIREFRHRLAHTFHSPSFHLSEFLKIEKYFLERYEAVMPALYILKCGLSAFRSASENMIMFNSVDLSGKSTIDSRTLHVNHIRDYTLRLVGKVTSTMDTLLFDNPMFTIDDHDFVHEDPRSRQPSYGFVDDSRNSWYGKTTVLEYIIRTPCLFDRFAYLDHKGKTCWKPGSCYLFMVQIYQLQLSLFILTLLT
jgi:hypothetical protein